MRGYKQLFAGDWIQALLGSTIKTGICLCACFFCNAILFAQWNYEVNFHRFNFELWENLTSLNLKLLVIYTIQKSKGRLPSFVRNILLALNQEATFSVQLHRPSIVHPEESVGCHQEVSFLSLQIHRLELRE